MLAQGSVPTPSPQKKGHSTSLSYAVSFSQCGTHQAFQLGPATFPQGLAQLSERGTGGERAQMGGASKESPNPHHQNWPEGNLVGEGKREGARAAKRGLHSEDLFEFGVGTKLGLKPTLLLAPSQRLFKTKWVFSKCLRNWSQLCPDF